MIKHYQNSAGVMTRIADAVIVVVAWFLAYPIRFEWFAWIPFPGLPDIEHYISLIPLVFILWVAGFQAFGVYRYDRVIRRSTEIYTMLRAHLLTMVLFTSLTYFITQYRFSRGVILIFGVLVFVGAWLFRVISRKILRELHRKGIRSTKMIAIGSGRELQFLLNQIGRYPELGITVVKVVTPDEIDSVPDLVKKVNPNIILLGLPPF